MIVMPPGGFHFNINGLMVCEPYFISNNILAFAACLFYFPTTMILMYCYGTIFHSAKVKIQYKRAVLTALPFLGGVSQDHIEHIAKQVRKIFKKWNYKVNTEFRVWKLVVVFALIQNCIISNWILRNNVIFISNFALYYNFLCTQKWLESLCISI